MSSDRVVITAIVFGASALAYGVIEVRRVVARLKRRRGRAPRFHKAVAATIGIAAAVVGAIPSASTGLCPPRAIRAFLTAAIVGVGWLLSWQISGSKLRDEPIWRTAIRYGARRHPLYVAGVLPAALGVLAGAVDLGLPGGDLGASLAVVALICAGWRLGSTAHKSTQHWRRIVDIAVAEDKVARLRVVPEKGATEDFWGANVELVRGQLKPALDSAARIVREEAGRDWRVTVDAPNRTIRIGHYVDPLRDVVEWPYAPGQTVPCRDGYPIGILESGRELRLPVIGVGWMIGGLPNSGKSNCGTVLITGLASQRHVALIGLDMKVVEHLPWRRRFSRVVTDEDLVIDVLRACTAHVDERYGILGAQDQKKSLVPTREMPHIVVIAEELAELTATGDSRADKARATEARRIAGKARAALTSFAGITQKPHSAVIPTYLRDLLAIKICFATTNPAMTDTVLGEGMAEAGARCHEISLAEKGIGYVVSDASRVPQRFRAYYIPDEMVPILARSYAHLRVELPWLDAVTQRGLR